MLDLNIDLEEEGLHMPRRVDPPREEILKSISAYNNRDDENLLSQALSNNLPKSIDL